MWSADTGKSPSNLELRTRVVGGDGKPLGAITTLGLSRQGKPNTGNAWMPHIARGSNKVWLTGAWGVEGAQAFQVLAQELDERGATKGDALDVAFEPKVTQSQTVVAVDAAGKRWIAWAQEPNEGSQVAAAWVRGEGGEAREVVPGGGNPSIASGASGTWLAAKGAAVELGRKPIWFGRSLQNIWDTQNGNTYQSVRKTGCHALLLACLLTFPSKSPNETTPAPATIHPLRP